MSLKELFILIMDRKPYSVSGLDTSAKSKCELISYLCQTYSDTVKSINILNLDAAFLDDLLDGEDISMKVVAALSKIDQAVPHLNLKACV